MIRFTLRPTFNLFAIPFGLAGLAGAFGALPRGPWAIAAFETAAWISALAVWTVLLASYVARAGSVTALVDDLRDPTFGPFAALVPLVGLMLVTHFLGNANAVVTLTLAALAFFGSTALAGWFTARWMLGDADLAHVHPGYLLPTVGASLVSAVCFAQLGIPSLAYALTGIGVMSWIVVTGLFVIRGFVGHGDLGALTPTLAIHAAPAPVLGILWFALDSPGGTEAGLVLVGLTAFGVATQVFLIPRYARLAFAPSFWSFTFSSAAVASFAALWVDYAKLPAWLAVAPVVVVVALIAAIGARHLIDPAVSTRRDAVRKVRQQSTREASRELR